MIRYALICEQGHDFESWFQDSAAYDKQTKRGLVTCPQCGSAEVEKAAGDFDPFGCGEFGDAMSTWRLPSIRPSIIRRIGCVARDQITCASQAASIASGAKSELFAPPAQ